MLGWVKRSLSARTLGVGGNKSANSAPDKKEGEKGAQREDADPPAPAHPAPDNSAGAAEEKENAGARVPKLDLDKTKRLASGARPDPNLSTSKPGLAKTGSFGQRLASSGGKTSKRERAQSAKSRSDKCDAETEAGGEGGRPVQVKNPYDDMFNQKAKDILKGTLGKLKGKGIGKAWVRQLFVLKQDALWYGVNDKFSHVEKKIPLAYAQIGTAENLTSRPNAFGVLDFYTKEMHVMAAESREAMEDWIRAMHTVRISLESKATVDGRGKMWRPATAPKQRGNEIYPLPGRKGKGERPSTAAAGASKDEDQTNGPGNGSGTAGPGKREGELQLYSDSDEDAEDRKSVV